MVEGQPKRNSIAPLFQFDLRFMLFATTLAGIGILWWQDRQSLEQRLAAIEVRYRPFVGNAWAADQAVGEPDTPSPGDQRTAWASMSPDGQEEWLELTYERVVRANAIEIHETYNPGAVTKVTAFDASENEVVVWHGTDPTPTNAKSGVSKITLNNLIETNRIRVYLDSQNVKGWNEIDAVGLRYGMFGNVIWARKSTASSEFGSSLGPVQISGLLFTPTPISKPEVQLQ